MMARTTYVVFALLSLFASVSSVSAASGSSDSADSHVIVLTDANFDELTSSGSWLLEFYAPWCGHCKTLAPTYEDAARKLAGSLNLAKIDATVNTKLAARYDIKGFPSIKFFREGEIRNYNGARTVDGIVNFGKEMMGPSVTQLLLASNYAMLEDEAPVSVVFFGNKGGVERRVFDSLAFRLQGLVKFVAVDKAQTEVYTKAGIKADETPLVVLVTKNADSSDPSNRFSGPWEESSLRQFIVKNKLPLISTLDQNNFDDVTTSGKKIVYAILNSDNTKASTDYINTLYRVAKLPAFRDQFVFASVDGLKYNKYVGQFGVAAEKGKDVSQLPTVVVLETDLDYYYAPPAAGKTNPDGTDRLHPIGDHKQVEQFLRGILDGSVALTGTIPWYNPSRYVKVLEKNLSKLPVWQVAVLAVAVMLSIVALMFWCCFYGLDAADPSQIAAEQAQLQAEASPKAASGGDASDSNDSSDESSSKNEGLRSRKGN